MVEVGYPDWLANKVGVYEITDWSAFAGLSKSFIVNFHTSAGSMDFTTVYTVPSNKVFLLTDLAIVRLNNVGTAICYADCYKGADLIYLAFIAGQQGAMAIFKTPKVVPSGWTIRVYVYNVESTDADYWVVLGGLEVEV